MVTRVLFLLGLVFLSPAFPRGRAAEESGRVEASPGAGASGRGAPAWPEAQPDAYYLKDKDGNLVLVPDISFEELERLIRLDEQANHPQPRPFTLQSMAIRGSAARGEASLEAEFQILLHREGWVRVPLRWNDAVLRAPPRGEGSVQIATEYQKDGDGYVCWLRGAQDSPITLSLEFLAPVVRLGEDSRLSLTVPLAAASQLKMTVDVPEASATVSGGANLLPPRPLPEGRTELTAVGLEGEFQLAWRPGASRPGRPPAALQASGVVRVDVMEGRPISCDVQLTVQSFGGPIDSFLVRLPKGMRLLPLPQSGYEVSAASQGETESALVEVQLDRGTTEAAKVRFLAESVDPMQAGGSPVEVAGFEVLNAIRQQGRIDVAVEGDWTVHWNTDANIRRRDDPPEELEREGIAARFEYFRQPCRLELELAPRERHIRVAPSYRVLIDPRNVHLTASLQYRIQGATADRVQVSLDGWEVDRVLPDEVVDAERLDLSAVTPLSIPLVRSAEGLSGDLELTIQAHRSLPQGAQVVSFTLPHPKARVMARASVVIEGADSVDLTPRPEAMEGLIEDVAPPEGEWASSGRAPLVYLDVDDSAPARFSADFLVRRRVALAALTGLARLTEKRVELEQRIAYQIAYESVSSLVLEIPQTALTAGDLTVLLDDEPLPLVQLPEEGGEPGTRTRWKANLGKPRIGSCELVVRYSEAMPALRPRQSTAISLPLVLPSTADGTTIVSNSLELFFDNSLRVKPAGGGWTASAEAASAGSSPGRIRLAAEVPADHAPLNVTWTGPRQSELVRVRQAWLQTWYGREQRRDRAAFRIVAAGKQVQIQLPPDAARDRVTAAWDGRPIEQLRILRGGILQIDTPRAAPTQEYQEHVVEVWCEADSGGVATGRRTVTPPRIVGADRADRSYWQIVTPAGMHLLAGPSGWTSDMSWRWRGFYWERRGNLSQVDLENWIGATRQDPPPAAMNQYLFTSFHRAGPLAMVTVSRPLLVLTASGAALLVGLLLIYYSALRRPAVLLVPAILLIAGAFLFPEPCVLIGQAAALGLALLLGARWLESVVARRRFRRPMVRGRTYSMADSKSRQRVAAAFGSPSETTASTSPTPARAPASGGAR